MLPGRPFPTSPWCPGRGRPADAHQHLVGVRASDGRCVRLFPRGHAVRRPGRSVPWRPPGCWTRGRPPGPFPAGGRCPSRSAARSGIPRNASAVVLNLTATETKSFGFLTAYAAGSSKPRHVQSELRGGADRAQPRRGPGRDGRESDGHEHVVRDGAGHCRRHGLFPARQTHPGGRPPRPESHALPGHAALLRPRRGGRIGDFPRARRQGDPDHRGRCGGQPDGHRGQVLRVPHGIRLGVVHTEGRRACSTCADRRSPTSLWFRWGRTATSRLRIPRADRCRSSPTSRATSAGRGSGPWRNRGWVSGFVAGRRVGLAACPRGAGAWTCVALVLGRHVGWLVRCDRGDMPILGARAWT